MAVLVKDCFIAPRLALLNNDREMISNLKIFHRKNLLPSIRKLKDRGGSTSKDLNPFSDLYLPASAKHLSPYR